MGDYTTLQIRLSNEDKAMIKADAKALGMTPGSYVAMVCRLVNESTREAAAEQLAMGVTKAVMRGYNKAIKVGTLEE